MSKHIVLAISCSIFKFLCITSPILFVKSVYQSLSWSLSKISLTKEDKALSKQFWNLGVLKIEHWILCCSEALPMTFWEALEEKTCVRVLPTSTWITATLSRLENEQSCQDNCCTHFDHSHCRDSPMFLKMRNSWCGNRLLNIIVGMLSVQPRLDVMVCVYYLGMSCEYSLEKTEGQI